MFARDAGLTVPELLSLLARANNRVEHEASAVWEGIMRLMDRKLGEIMGVRIEIERREAQIRKAKVLANQTVRRRRVRLVR